MTGLALVADVAAHTLRLVETLEGRMAKKRKKLDYDAHWERIRQARELVERERRRLREQRDAEGPEQKST